MMTSISHLLLIFRYESMHSSFWRKKNNYIPGRSVAKHQLFSGCYHKRNHPTVDVFWDSSPKIRY